MCLVALWVYEVFNLVASYHVLFSQKPFDKQTHIFTQYHSQWTFAMWSELASLPLMYLIGSLDYTWQKWALSTKITNIRLTHTANARVCYVGSQMIAVPLSKMNYRIQNNDSNPVFNILFILQEELVSPHSLTDGTKLYTGFKNCIRIFDTGRPGRTCQVIYTYG